MRYGVSALITGLALPAAVQTYPNKPVRLVVPFPAGGGVDVTARILAQALTARVTQSFSEFVQKEIPRWAKVVKDANVKAP